MFNLTFYHNACVGIRTDDISILCDPWLLDGAFYGSWYLYPPVDDPLDLVGQYDCIWVSHVHPDHYDVDFLRMYLDRYPDTQVFCGNEAGGKMLSHRMDLDGIPHESVPRIIAGETIATIYADTSSVNSIDTALVVVKGDQSLVNSCDIEYRDGKCYADMRAIAGGQPTLGLVNYAPAGSRPQCLTDVNRNLRRLYAGMKKTQFLQTYMRKQHALNPAVTIPFASNYLLGGKLHSLNLSRGATDPVEILSWDDTCVVLDRGGVFDLETMQVDAGDIRTVTYDWGEVLAYAASTKDNPMVYELEPTPEEIPVDLVRSSYDRAQRNRGKPYDWFMVFSWGEDEVIVCNVRSGSDDCRIISLKDTSEMIYPRTEIQVNKALLLGVLEGRYHWNNVEVGSHWGIRICSEDDHQEFSPEDWLYFFQQETV